MASTNLATSASNQISNGVNKTAQLVNSMSDVLMMALNTTNNLKVMDRTHVLGGRLSNVSSVFLNQTTNAVTFFIHARLNALNNMISSKTGIAAKILHLSQDFINKTSQWLSKLLTVRSTPRVVPLRLSRAAEKLHNASINLVNSTGESLANVINSASVLLSKSLADNTQFTTNLLNSTAELLNSTTGSLESLLNKTNHLIANVVESRANTSIEILNQTDHLLNASTRAINSFLNATTLMIDNATKPNATVTEHRAAVTTLQKARNALDQIFSKTSSLIQGVILAEKNILLRLVNATGNFLNATVQIKSTIVNGTLDRSKNITDSVSKFVASNLNKISNKLTSESVENAPVEANPVEAVASEADAEVSPTLNDVPLNEDDPELNVNEDVSEDVNEDVSTVSPEDTRQADL